MTSLNIMRRTRAHAARDRPPRSVRRAGERRQRRGALLRERRPRERDRARSRCRTSRRQRYSTRSARRSATSGCIPKRSRSQNVRANLNTALSPTFDSRLTTGFTKTNSGCRSDNNFFSICYQSMMSPASRQPGPGIHAAWARSARPQRLQRLQYRRRSSRTCTQKTSSASSAARTRTGGRSLAAERRHRRRRSRRPRRTCALPLQRMPGLRERCAGLRSTTRTTNNRNFSAKLDEHRDVAGDARGRTSRPRSARTTRTRERRTERERHAAAAGRADGRSGGGDDAAATRCRRRRRRSAATSQEQVAFRDRLFLTVAVRTDQNSAFGTNFQRVFYPKASLSWIMSDESFFPHYRWLNQFRLRSAYGASGVQPGRHVGARHVLDDADRRASTRTRHAAASRASALGNPNLKPETSAEFEGGFDTRVLEQPRQHRVHVLQQADEGRADQPADRAVGGRVGHDACSRNLGSIKNTGIEATLTATLVDRRDVRLGRHAQRLAQHEQGRVARHRRNGQRRVA